MCQWQTIRLKNLLHIGTHERQVVNRYHGHCPVLFILPAFHKITVRDKRGVPVVRMNDVWSPVDLVWQFKRRQREEHIFFSIQFVIG